MRWCDEYGIIITEELNVHHVRCYLGKYDGRDTYWQYTNSLGFKGYEDGSSLIVMVDEV